jgi:hypothetical protein
MDLKKCGWTKPGLIFILLLIFVVTPALAVNYGGNINYTSPVTSESYTIVSGGPGNLITNYIKQIKIIDIVAYTNISSLYCEYYNGTATAYPGIVNSVTHNAGFSASVPVSLYIGSHYIGSGWFGYNDNLATGKTNVLLSLNDFDATGYTGNQIINMSGDASFTANGCNGLRTYNFQIAPAEQKGMFYISTTHAIGLPTTAATIIKSYSFNQEWRTTEIGVSVKTDVIKSGWKSRVYLYQTPGTLIYDEGSYSTIDYTYTTLIKPIGFAIKDSAGVFHNTSFYYTGVGSYSMTVEPPDISFNATSNGAISSPFDPTLSMITAVNWQYYVTDKYTDLYDFYENGDNVNGMNYVKKGANWYGWNVNDMDFTNNKSATLPNPVTPYPQSSGNLTVYLTIFTLDGNMQELTAPLSVGLSGNFKTIILGAADWQAGMLISPVNWSVKNLYTNKWTNKTSTSGDGTWTVQYSAGVALYVEANAYGYAKGTLTKQVPNGNDIWILQLYPLSVVSGNITNSTLLVKVMGDNNDGKFQPLNNVAVTLSDNQYQLTASLGGVAGQAQFTVKNDTIYSISGKKDKYVSVTKTVFVTGDIYTATLFMSPLAGSTVIPTTATPRPTATPTVTLSGYQPAYGNFTGFWAPFENMGVAMGAQPGEVGVLMMFLLIIGFLILGGWAAGPLGAEVGVVAGMVCSVAFGFLPFAISIAVIAILCLYGALRIWGVTR